MPIGQDLLPVSMWDTRAIAHLATPETNARQVRDLFMLRNFMFFMHICCLSDVDECASSPCINRGTCIDGVDKYTCICTSGYTGNICETSECNIFLTF